MYVQCTYTCTKHIRVHVATMATQHEIHHCEISGMIGQVQAMLVHTCTCICTHTCTQHMCICSNYGNTTCEISGMIGQVHAMLVNTPTCTCTYIHMYTIRTGTTTWPLYRLVHVPTVRVSFRPHQLSWGDWECGYHTWDTCNAGTHV